MKLETKHAVWQASQHVLGTQHRFRQQTQLEAGAERAAAEDDRLQRLVATHLMRLCG